MLLPQTPFIELKIKLHNNSNYYSLSKILRKVWQGYTLHTYRKRREFYFRRIIIDIENKRIICFDDINTYIRISSKNNEPIIDANSTLTIVINKPLDLITFLSDFISLNKDIDASGGWQNYFIKNKRELEEFMRSLDFPLEGVSSRISIEDLHPQFDVAPDDDSVQCDLCDSDSISKCLLSDPQKCPYQ